jgi:ribosomal protein S18 acetylase RimI-like enzyme
LYEYCIIVLMKNREFLETYQLLQYSIVFNRLFDLGSVSVSLSDTLPGPFFNYAQTDMLLDTKEVLQAEDIFLKTNRHPTFYFEDKPELLELLNLLEGRGYRKSWEDSWMFYSGSKPEDKLLDNVKTVTNEEELEVFLSTFNESYQSDDPQNPLGALGSYVEHVREIWKKHSFSGKVEYFVAFDPKGHPAAVSTLTNFGGIGYISNVGSLRHFRGEGYGRKATMYCIKRSMEKGNTVHCLATEKESYPYNFYSKNGFDVAFTAIGMSKS